MLELRESLERREEYLRDAASRPDFNDEDHLWAELARRQRRRSSPTTSARSSLKELRKALRGRHRRHRGLHRGRGRAHAPGLGAVPGRWSPRRSCNDETLFRELKERFGSPYGFGEYFRGGMGAEAVRDLLEQVDLDAERVELEDQVKTAKGQKQARAVKRLKVVSAFIQLRQQARR